MTDSGVEVGDQSILYPRNAVLKMQLFLFQSLQLQLIKVGKTVQRCYRRIQLSMLALKIKQQYTQLGCRLISRVVGG